MTDIKLIGGEMANWSDRRPEGRAPAGGAVLTHLLGTLAAVVPSGGRVLVAGPHDDALVDTVAAYARVTCLLRSQPDADAAAARGVAVVCGTLAKLTDFEHYDAVIALDGLDRLCSVEGPQYDWAEALQVLRRALRPGGTLLLTVENDLGVHRLVDRGMPTSPLTDADWNPVGEYDETRPGNPARLTARLLADGLAIGWLGAAWPLPQAPTLLATPDALRDGPVAALSAYAAGAFGRAYAGRPVLSDPRRLAATAVRAGLAADLACAWLVVAQRRAQATATPTLPPVLYGEGPVVALENGGDGWVRRAVAGDADLDGALPTGRLLEELLIAAALRYDLGTIRRLLTGFAAWLGTLDDDLRMHATVDTVLLDGDVYALLDPSRRDVAVDTATAAAAAMRRFAETLVAGGYAHPWPAAGDVESLTAVLAGAAGLSVDVAPAVPDSPPAPLSLREHHERIRSLQQQLADTRAQVRWHEKELTKRDKELGRARRQIAAFEGTLRYRVARLGVDAARRARNALRQSRR